MCQSDWCEDMFGDAGDYGIEWKMVLNLGFTIQMGLESQNTSYENIMGAKGHILALYILFKSKKGEISMSCLVTSDF